MKLALILSFSFLASAAHATALSEQCIQKAERLALLAAVPDAPSLSSFRSLRLGMFGGQGSGAEKYSPYVIDGGNIRVIVSNSFALKPTDTEDNEVQNSEFYQMRIIDAKQCKLGAAENVTPE